MPTVDFDFDRRLTYSMSMKERIKELIQLYVRQFADDNNVTGIWGTPSAGFADARHPYITGLKKAVSGTHSLPTDIMPDAVTVIAYFVPFTKHISDTNKKPGWLASTEWAAAYEETNAMFASLNAWLIEEIKAMGHKAVFPEQAVTFDTNKLISNWSHRHFAYAAGLGTFGLNNLLITENGCCGRYSSLVTDIDVVPDSPQAEEFCTYKNKGTCAVCVSRCPSGALTKDGYDRQKCYEICLKNAKVHTGLGCSYVDENGQPISTGSDVCGKCAVSLPCSFKRP